MAKLNFDHKGESYTVKGEWDGDTFTATAFLGRKAVSDPFSITREKSAKNLAADDALEAAAMQAAKNDVLDGNTISA